MISVILFCICLAASGIGAIVGAGGGVIIKPVLDMFGILPLSTIGFCSGCTVLGMSVSSLIRNRKDGIKLRVEISTPLAIGAVIGGLLGQYAFNTLLEYFSKPKILGIIQAFLLAIMMIGVYAYVEKKSTIKSLNIQSKFLSAFIGFLLGLSSSFLGIGGGPANVAVLFYFFSMNAKEAAKNSLYVIIFSQLSSLGLSMYRGTIPEVEIIVLVSMIAGGIGGAVIGSKISKRIDNKGVEKLLKGFLIVIIAINIYNIFKYMLI